MFKQNSEAIKNYHIISAKKPLSAISEQYRKLRTNIDYSTFNETLKIINLTSTMPSEGKTVTVLNLATVYAQSEAKTLVIDMDLRKPKLHRAFNIVNDVGLTQVVTKGIALDDVIFEADEYLHVLPAGEKLPFPAEFLMSNKLKAFIESIKDKYDKIIIDCPPMTAVTDASIISKLTDGTAIVIASRMINADIIKSIIKTLKENGANILGGILTRVQKKDHRYISGYYYNYHEYTEAVKD